MRTISLLSGFLGLLLSGCAIIEVDQGVTFFSEPAGAEIFIDGTSTGEYTPCQLNMNMLKAGVAIEFRKSGYETEKRPLQRLFSLGLSRPSTASSDLESVILLPVLYWTAEDVLIPIKSRQGFYPNKLYVKLFKEDGQEQ